ncbi:MAG: hypothetical protein AAF368_06425, partial [Planctomycetota bacterium]
MRSLPLLAGATLYQLPNVQAQVLSTTEHQVLEADTVGNEFYGGAIAMDGDTLVVGAQLADVNGEPDAGRVYVYSRGSGSWMLEDTLIPNDTGGGQRFGSSVDIDGDRILVGASFEYELAPAGGAAYVFERTGSSWNQTAKIFDDNPGFARFFGSNVELDGDHALIGADDTNGSATAIVTVIHTFSLNGGNWQFDGSITPTLFNGEFGEVVAGRPGEFCVLERGFDGEE